MSMSSMDKYHRAARDGYLDLLRDANKRDCNTQDEDGMTPTLCAAACGNLDALRLIVGRGGDPDRCDWYGNTALHCAAANGHINCVSFLVNFGVNIWSLDNELHSPKDVAGNKNHEEILRFLDEEMSKQAKLNKKNVMSLKEKAVKDAEKRVKEFEKIQSKAFKKAAKEDKKMQKVRERIGEAVSEDRRPSLSLINPRRDSRVLYASPKYSDIVSSNSSKKTGVQKKIEKQKMKSFPNSPVDGVGAFKVRDFENGGHQSIRSITGLRKNSEILFVPKFDTSPGDGDSSSNSGTRKTLNDVFGSHSMARSSSVQHLFADENNVGMFERPGFGNVAFRKNSLTGAMLSSMSAEYTNGGVKKRPALHGMGNDDDDDDGELGSAGEGSGGDSIGSAGSLARRDDHDKWYNSYENDDDDDDDRGDVSSHSALETFLTAHDLMACFHYLKKEHIDLKALLMLDEGDLREIGIPMGIRKKMLEAIGRRKNILSDAGDVYDSRL